MTVHFGAKFSVTDHFRPPTVEFAEYRKLVMDSFQENPASKLILANTSDEISLNMHADDESGLNVVTAHINGASSDLPEDLQAWQNGKLAVVRFPSSQLLDQDLRFALQQIYNNNLAQISDRLAEFNQSRKIQTQVAEGKAGLSAVAGMKDLKKMLERQVVTPILHPEKVAKYGKKIPNGILLYGAPGCGKTYIVQRLAEELGKPFLSLEMSDVGTSLSHETTKAMAEKFDEAEKLAKENGSCVLFIDEIESFLPNRGSLSGLNKHDGEEITELLKRMNKIRDKGVVLVAASNRPEMMDPAALRSGRMDKHIYVPPPDAEAREAALLYHMREHDYQGDIDYKLIAELTKGFSQADIELLVEEAVDEAIEQDGPITTQSFLDALPRVPASVPAKVERDYKKAFQTRGTSANMVTEDEGGMGFTAKLNVSA